MARSQYTFGGNVDLDAEEITHGGERLTEARAEALAGDVLTAHGRGRPSLAGGESPVVHVRVTQAVKHRLTELARREHRKPGAVAREAIEAYLAAHGG